MYIVYRTFYLMQFVNVTSHCVVFFVVFPVVAPSFLW